MVEPNRNIHLNLLELNHLYRYNLFINLVIPAQAGTQTHPNESYWIKRFPQFHVLDSRLRGNDG